MTNEWWDKVERLYHAARELEGASRSRFLDEACTDDAMRHKIDELLAQDEKPETFLTSSALALNTIALSSGMRLGPYQILDPIGAGGMGEVFRARDSRLQRDVAIKTLPAEFAQNPKRLARFEREARLLASLNHPNIASIHDIVEDGSARHLVLELVEGTTLAERLGQGRLPLDEVLPIARQIAEALEAAHKKGIVHRDLKPANIKIMPDGKVKVLDFGLAKIYNRDGSGAELSQAPTEPGMILGTPAYMSPEQARGEEVDERADIWAFGCVLFEMLTGRKAFQGETVSDTIASILKSDPDWSLIPPTIPAAWNSLLRRCLRKDARRRVHSASDVRIEIEDIEAQPQVMTETSERRNRFLVVALAAGVLLLAAALAATLMYPRGAAPDARDVRFQIYPPDGYSFASGPAISPDGRHVAFLVRNKERLLFIAIRDIDDINSRILAGTEGAMRLFWSADSRSIGFAVQERTLKAVDIAGGVPRSLSDVPGFTSATWNAEGTIVFASRNRGAALYRVAASGGTPERLNIPGQKLPGAPQFLRDNRHFLFTEFGKGTYIGALDSTETQRIADTSTDWVYAIGNQLLLARGGVISMQAFDAKTARLIGKPVVVPELSSATTFSLSTNGVLATRQSLVGMQLAWFNRIGEQLSTVGPMQNFDSVQVSPDGKWIAAKLRSSATGPFGIWLIESLRGIPSRWRFETSPQDPVWSPNGSLIVFSSFHEGVYELGQGSTFSSSAASDEIVFKSQFNKSPLDWSADGRFLLYYERDSTGSRDLWALPLPERRNPLRITQTPFDEVSGQFSPDGRWIAYTSDELGERDVYIQDFPKGTFRRRVSAGGGASPRWKGDGTELFFVDPAYHVMSAPLKLDNPDAQGGPQIGTPVSLFQAELSNAQFAVSPDGQRFLLKTRVESSVAPITVVVNWEPPQN